MQPDVDGARNTSTPGALHDYAYIEVMACPGGCTNGGGQLRADDARSLAGAGDTVQTESPTATATAVATPAKPSEQRAWLAKVDAAYFGEQSAATASTAVAPETATPTSTATATSPPLPPAGQPSRIADFLAYWAELTGAPLAALTETTYRAVESDVGKKRAGAHDTASVAVLAGKIGGGW
ncbi:Cytosolic Fe-S cluster assembly factor nar1 [Ascosphaera acerosa]|nr:Cytosolic Fe-S cluster assembly factor nar1 [Ascosphaera acerosa]